MRDGVISRPTGNIVGLVYFALLIRVFWERASKHHYWLPELNVKVSGMSDLLVKKKRIFKDNVRYGMANLNLFNLQAVGYTTLGSIITYT